MHATLPLLAATDFPALRRKSLQTLQVNLGYKCNQSCLHCHVNAGPQPYRDDGRCHRRSGARDSAGAPGANAGPDRRRARTECAFQASGERRAGLGGARDRPLQPDHPVRTGARRPGRLPGRRGRGSRGVDALLFGRKRRPPARRGRVRPQHRRAAGTQRAGLWQTRLRSRVEPGLQPAGTFAAAAAGATAGRLRTRTGAAFRHRFQRIVRADQHADPALRQHTRQQGHVSWLTWTCSRVPTRPTTCRP